MEYFYDNYDEFFCKLNCRLSNYTKQQTRVVGYQDNKT